MKYEMDVKWITVNGNHIPIKPGQTVEQAVAERFDDTDDVEIDVETEDENIKYDTVYYYQTGWPGYMFPIDKSQIDEYKAKGYTVHEINVTDEMQKVLTDALEDPGLKENNIRRIMYTMEERLKIRAAGILNSDERRLLAQSFRKKVIEKAKVYADEFLETLPKTKQSLPDACCRDTNSVGYKESLAAKYNSKEYDYYTSNCQRCIIAYEMRRRGYDVEANKYIGRGDSIYNENLALTRAFLNFDSMTNTKRYENQPNGEKYSSRGALIRAMEKDMVAEGEGARFAVAWKWKNSSWGHTINAEVIDGKVTFFDAQCNKSYTAKDLINRKDIRATTLKFDRIDNLILSNRLEDLVKWKK